jgi:hypothetical protein
MISGIDGRNYNVYTPASLGSKIVSASIGSNNADKAVAPTNDTYPRNSLANRVNAYASASMGSQLIDISAEQYGLSGRALTSDEVELANEYKEYREFITICL